MAATSLLESGSFPRHSGCDAKAYLYRVSRTSLLMPSAARRSRIKRRNRSRSAGFGAVMQITQSFAVADISIALAGNPSVNYSGATIVTHLLDYGSTRLDMGYASAIATILFLLMVGTNKLVQRILRRVGE